MGDDITAASGGQVDRHGFLTKTRDINGAAAPLTAEARKKMIKSQRKYEGKWRPIRDHWDEYMAEKSDKIKRRCRKGVPESLRAWVWAKLCGMEVMKEKYDNADIRKAKYNNRPGFEFFAATEFDVTHPAFEGVEIIDRDLDRTFPHHELFVDKEGQGQQTLRAVLRAYAAFNPTLGYCQGMGMVAGMFLMYMVREDAFWCLVSLLEQVRCFVWCVVCVICVMCCDVWCDV